MQYTRKECISILIDLNDDRWGDGAVNAALTFAIEQLSSTERCQECGAVRAMTCTNSDCHMNGFFRSCDNLTHEVCVDPQCLGKE